MGRRTARFLSSLASMALALSMPAILALAAGCGHGRPASGASPVGGRVTTVTADEIAAMGARTAWDVVRARAPRLYATGDGSGRPTDLRIQEPRSVNADEAPLLVVDGAQNYDLDWLTELRASEIAFLRIMDAQAAEPIYGLRAAGGAIVIVTRGAR